MQLRYWMIFGSLCACEKKHDNIMTTIKSLLKFSTGLLTPYCLYISPLVAHLFSTQWAETISPETFQVFQREEVQEHLLKLRCETGHVAKSAVLGANFLCFTEINLPASQTSIRRLQQGFEPSDVRLVHLIFFALASYENVFVANHPLINVLDHFGRINQFTDSPLISRHTWDFHWLSLAAVLQNLSRSFRLKSKFSPQFADQCAPGRAQDFLVSLAE